jgi:hypothetical protein
MKKLLPKHLGGQLILLLLGALTLSHLLGFLIFSDERRQAMRTVHHPSWRLSIHGACVTGSRRKPLL